MIKGFRARPAPHLGYRDADPAWDTDLEGRVVRPPHVSFVYLSECNLFEEEGRKFYSAGSARAIPVSHAGTWYAFGAWRKYSSPVIRDFFHYEGCDYNLYATCPVYFARNGRVYTATQRLPIARLPRRVREELVERMTESEREHFERDGGVFRRWPTLA